MSGRKSRLYRAAANQNAKRNNVFAIGARGFMKWYRKLIAAIFPGRRKRYDRAIGWWYKRWLKKEAHRIATIDRDPDTRAFMATRKKVFRQHMAKKDSAK